MKKFLFVSVVCLGLSGCGTLDSFVGYNPETGEVAPDAPVATVTEAAKGFGPWGEILAGIVGLAAGGYVVVRKIQKKLSADADKKTPQIKQ